MRRKRYTPEQIRRGEVELSRGERRSSVLTPVWKGTPCNRRVIWVKKVMRTLRRRTHDEE